MSGKPGPIAYDNSRYVNLMGRGEGPGEPELLRGGVVDDAVLHRALHVERHPRRKVVAVAVRQDRPVQGQQAGGGDRRRRCQLEEGLLLTLRP